MIQCMYRIKRLMKKELDYIAYKEAQAREKKREGFGFITYYTMGEIKRIKL